MSKKNFKQECSEVVYDLMHSCYDELNLFCEIIGLPKSEVNRFIGDDPHGIADIMEGYRYFNMTDIHVVIADYARWLTIYKDNQTLRKVVDEWYYWKTWKATLPCNLKNWLMGWRPKPEDCLPYYNEHQAQEQAAAQKRVEQAKADLEQEVKQFNEGRKF